MKMSATLMLACISCFSATLNFNEALSKALQNDKSLKMSDLSLKISKQESDKKFAEMFGVVSVSENYSNTNNAMAIFGDKLSSRQATFSDFGFGQFMQNQNNPNVVNIAPTNLNKPGVLNNYETAVEYSLPIFSGFAGKNAHESAKLAQRAKEQSYAWDRKTLSLNVLMAYNNAVAAKEFVVAAENTKNAAEALHKRVLAFYNQKLASKIDLLEAEQFVARANAIVAKSTENYTLSITTLKYITGSKDISDVSGFATIDNTKKNFEDLKLQLANRDDILKSGFEQESASKAYSASKASLLPSVNGYAKYMTNNTFPNFNNDYGSYFVGVGIKYTLFDGGKDSSDRESARLAWHKAAIAHEKAKEDADLALEKAYLSANSKQKIYEEKKKASELADMVDDKYKIMYENGLTSLSERLKKLSQKTEARAEMIGANADMINANGELRIYSGYDLMEANR